jgi:DNA polymerase-3 subunit delta'
VLPTIASRCQVVRFRRIPESEAAALLRSQTGAEYTEAAAALAASGGVVARARDFLASPPRREARALILRVLAALPCADDAEVLHGAKELLGAVKAPLEDVKAVQAAEALDRADFMGRSGAKALEERHKRELTAREREGIGEVLNVAESWLRDCLVVSQGVGDLAVNIDVAESVKEVASVMTPGAAARALEAVNVARRRISYNVSPQLAIEAMLFDIREVLRCPR